MTVKQYERKLKATQKITEFMGSLAEIYSAEEMHRIWKRMEIMIGRYGLVYISDVIENKRDETELALLREVRA